MMTDKEQLEWIWKNCKVVHFPGGGDYPLEHVAAANKDSREKIEHCMEFGGGWSAENRWDKVALNAGDSLDPDFDYQVSFDNGKNWVLSSFSVAMGGLLYMRRPKKALV